MGFYIEVSDKEAWIGKYCKFIREAPASLYELAPTDLPVVLINNGSWRAIGIAYDDFELARFKAITDRPTLWFTTRKYNLDPFLPKLVRSEVIETL